MKVINYFNTILLILFLLFFLSLKTSSALAVGQACYSCEGKYVDFGIRIYYGLRTGICNRSVICYPSSIISDIFDHCAVSLRPDYKCAADEECDGDSLQCVKKGTSQNPTRPGIGDACACPNGTFFYKPDVNTQAQCVQKTGDILNILNFKNATSITSPISDYTAQIALQNAPKSPANPDNGQCTTGLTCNPRSGLCEDMVLLSGVGNPIRPKPCTLKESAGGFPISQGIYTAIGCIPTDPQELVNKLLPWIIGLAGGIAFILMLFGAFQVLTSTGDPEKLKKGKETLTSAIIGLLLIIFSVFILRIFGLPIMKISM